MINENDAKTGMELIPVGTESLVRIATFLEGMKVGRGGNILPMGTDDITQLWNVISYLKGDVRYTCPKRAAKDM